MQLLQDCKMQGNHNFFYISLCTTSLQQGNWDYSHKQFHWEFNLLCNFEITSYLYFYEPMETTFTMLFKFQIQTEFQLERFILETASKPSPHTAISFLHQGACEMYMLVLFFPQFFNKKEIMVID